MAYCTYGTRRKTGTPDYIWWLLSGFRSFLLASFSRIGAIFGIFLPDHVLTADTLCASEPTVRTAPTLSQWLGFITAVWADWSYVIGYLQELYVSSLWDTYCECSPDPGGGTCTYRGVTWSSLTDYGALTRQMGLVVQPQISGMSIYGAKFQVQSSGTPSATHLVVWDPTGTTILKDSGAFTPTAGLNTYLFATTLAVTSGSNYTVALYGAGAEHYFGWGTNGTDSSHSDVHYGSYVERDDNSFCPTGTSTYKRAIDPIICVGGPPAGDTPDYTPTAPTDPTGLPDNPLVACTTTADLCAKIADLLAWSQATRQDVNWLQSAIAPTCWVAGTAHTGLTGAGTIAVADVVGAYVTLTVPSTWGRTAETPPRYIPKLGELQFAIDTVVADGRQLHYTAEQLLGAPTATNSIVYNLRGGVTASITPLQRCK